jgi:hypothetical protein
MTNQNPDCTIHPIRQVKKKYAKNMELAEQKDVPLQA